MPPFTINPTPPPSLPPKKSHPIPWILGLAALIIVLTVLFSGGDTLETEIGNTVETEGSPVSTGGVDCEKILSDTDVQKAFPETFAKLSLRSASQSYCLFEAYGIKEEAGADLSIGVSLCTPGTEFYKQDVGPHCWTLDYGADLASKNEGVTYGNTDRGLSWRPLGNWQAVWVTPGLTTVTGETYGPVAAFTIETGKAQINGTIKGAAGQEDFVDIESFLYDLTERAKTEFN
jgi:hypothetical protein